MKNVFIVLVVINFLIASNYQVERNRKICESLESAFEKSDYLLKKFDDPIGAIEVVRMNTGAGRLLRSQKKPKCVEDYADKWFYLVSRAGSLYELAAFEKMYNDNAKLHLYLGDMYAQHNENQNALKQYKIYKKLKKTNIEKRVREYIGTSGYKHYESLWAKHLKLKNSVDGVYNNIYISTKTKQILAQDITDKLEYISGNHQKLKKYQYKPISSYHIKTFKLDKPKVYMFSLEAPLSVHTRIIVDDRLVLENRGSKHMRQKIFYAFEAGKHKIEIENYCKSPMMMIKFKMIDKQEDE